jgi:hypothetical protein
MAIIHSEYGHFDDKFRNTSVPDGHCPRCTHPETIKGEQDFDGVQLEYGELSDEAPNEVWYCPQCGINYEVVMVRDWDTITEYYKQ